MLAMIPATAVLSLMLAQGPPAASVRPLSTRAARTPPRRTTSSCWGATSSRRVTPPGPGRVPGGGTPRSAVCGGSCRARRLSSPRQGRVEDASREARAALALDPANQEANRILGSILASLVEPGTAGSPATCTRSSGRCTSSGDAAATAPTPTPRSTCCWRACTSRAASYDKAIALLQDLLERELIPEAYLLLAEAWNGAGNIRRGGACARGWRRGEPAPAGVARGDVRRAAAMGARPPVPTSAPRR